MPIDPLSLAIGAVAALAMLIWVMWGYSTAFGPEGNAFFSWGNLFLSATTSDSTAATFSTSSWITWMRAALLASTVPSAFAR